MDLSKRVVLLKASVKEGEYPTFTPEDMIFLFLKRFYLNWFYLKKEHAQKVWSMVIQILLGGAPMLLVVRQTYL